MTTTMIKQLDPNVIYEHDEIFKYIYENGGTFDMIYTVQCIGQYNYGGGMYVGASEALIEYKGLTYQCGHLWLNTRDTKDEVIRVVRQAKKRKQKGAKGMVRELSNVSVKSYRRKNGSMGYGVYKEPEENGPTIRYEFGTKKFIATAFEMDSAEWIINGLYDILNDIEERLQTIEETLNILTYIH